MAVPTCAWIEIHVGAGRRRKTLQREGILPFMITCTCAVTYVVVTLKNIQLTFLNITCVSATISELNPCVRIT